MGRWGVGGMGRWKKKGKTKSFFLKEVTKKNRKTYIIKAFLPSNRTGNKAVTT
jgi:hypothetical protein